MQEMNTLPGQERARVMEETLRKLTAEERKPIERLIRRLQYPDVPESFWQGVEDHERRSLGGRGNRVTRDAAAQMIFRASETFWRHFYELSSAQKNPSVRLGKSFAKIPSIPGCAAIKFTVFPQLWAGLCMRLKSKRTFASFLVSMERLSGRLILARMICINNKSNTPPSCGANDGNSSKQKT